MSDPNHGRHNADLELARGRLIQANTYKDCSTVIVVPAIAPIPVRVVQVMLGLMLPMNQKVFRLFVTDAEVGDAYNKAVETILVHPELSQFKYMLTMETDNAPPPDGLLKLYENIETYDAVGGLYWCKGESGAPMCYGQRDVIPKNFIPFLPPPNTITPCNGLGMGFTLFRIETFRQMSKPWFKTEQEFTPGVGGKAFTQDLWHFQEAAKLGKTCACDSRVLVGHWSESEKIMW